MWKWIKRHPYWAWVLLCFTTGLVAWVFFRIGSPEATANVMWLGLLFIFLIRKIFFRKLDKK